LIRRKRVKKRDTPKEVDTEKREAQLDDVLTTAKHCQTSVA
jgi:hypothetical protein